MEGSGSQKPRSCYASTSPYARRIKRQRINRPALALCVGHARGEAGWWLRSDIIWYKPNCQPESVKDRPTRSFEHIFLFAKSERYYYDVSAVKGPNGRRLRDVWDINTVAYSGAHFATFPPELVRRCVLIGTREGDYVLDPFMGSGTSGQVARITNRRFIGCEINKAYLPLILERMTKV